MRRIVRLCSTAPRSNDELAKKIGTTRESVQVLTHRMRRYGQIETLNPGTHQARHVAVGHAARPAAKVPPTA
ncbi:hypothetical protein CO641_02165 [Lysobacteraceae bacterium NML91-0213]|nr:hypothetical protein CO641_02165 [Xanthomonadaceae bacterium NML91-0213]